MGESEKEWVLGVVGETVNHSLYLYLSRSLYPGGMGGQSNVCAGRERLSEAGGGDGAGVGSGRGGGRG